VTAHPVQLHKPEEAKVGMPVEVVFEDASPDITLYKFKPA